MAKRSLYLESTHQACAVRALMLLERAGQPLTFAGDQNSAKRGSKAQREALMTGMRKGEADIRVYIEGGGLLLFELKTETGILSKDQKERHAQLLGLGFEVCVVKQEHPLDTATQICEAVAYALGKDSKEFRDAATTATLEVLSALTSKGKAR